jgi:hypothetical protein
VGVGEGGGVVEVGTTVGVEVGAVVGLIVGAVVGVAVGSAGFVLVGSGVSVGSGPADVAVGEGVGAGKSVGEIGFEAVGRIVSGGNSVGSDSIVFVGSGSGGRMRLPSWLFTGGGTLVGSNGIIVGKAATTIGEEGSSSQAKSSLAMGWAKVSPTSVIPSKSRRISAMISFLTDRTWRKPHCPYSAIRFEGASANGIRGAVDNANCPHPSKRSITKGASKSNWENARSCSSELSTFGGS